MLRARLDSEALSPTRPGHVRQHIGTGSLTRSDPRVSDDLARMALMVQGSGGGSSGYAVSPDVGLTRPLAKSEEELAERQSDLAVTKATVAHILADWDQAEQHTLGQYGDQVRAALPDIPPGQPSRACQAAARELFSRALRESQPGP